MQRKKAFTLIEILIVIAIISLLAVIGIPSLINKKSEAQEEKRTLNIASVEKAKAMLQQPPTAAHDYGKGLKAGAVMGTDFTETELTDCMQGVSALTELAVDGAEITVGDIGETASYPAP